MVVWMGEVGGLDVGIYLALFFWVCGILGLVVFVGGWWYFGTASGYSILESKRAVGLLANKQSSRDTNTDGMCVCVSVCSRTHYFNALRHLCALVHLSRTIYIYIRVKYIRVYINITYPLYILHIYILYIYICVIIYCMYNIICIYNINLVTSIYIYIYTNIFV